MGWQNPFGDFGKLLERGEIEVKEICEWVLGWVISGGFGFIVG